MTYKADPKLAYRARFRLSSAVANGRLVRASACSDCSRDEIPGDHKTRLHGHHPDYSKPLDVVWVCPKCHAKRHAQDRKEWNERKSKGLGVNPENRPDQVLIQVWIPAEWRDVAKRDAQTMSEWLRAAVREKLAKGKA